MGGPGENGLPGEEDELLDVGGRRARGLLSPRSARLLTWVGGGAVAVAAVVTLMHQSTPRHVAAPVPSATAAPSASSSIVERSLELPGPIDTIRALVARPGVLGDYVRQDTPAGLCAMVRVGHSPVTAALRAAARDLGPTRLIDVQRTIDQFTGLCSLDLRARMPGVVITISVTSAVPRTREAAYESIETGVETISDTTTEYALTHTRQGWTVLVGATGPQNRLPGSQQLLTLAQEPALTW